MPWPRAIKCPPNWIFQKKCRTLMDNQGRGRGAGAPRTAPYLKKNKACKTFLTPGYKNSEGEGC